MNNRNFYVIENNSEVKKKRFKKMHAYSALPNIMTVIALCCGASAIKLSIAGEFQYAVIAIIFAAFLDSMDGRLARFLNNANTFGAQLDSLADLVNFGVAPALVIYQFAFYQKCEYGWITCLLFITCSALRLARYNTMLINGTLSSCKFFQGVPAPLGAIIALMPMLYFFAVDGVYKSNALACIISLLVSGILMISRISTFSSRHLSLKNNFPILLLFTLIFGGFINAPWLTLFMLSVAYLCLLPISYIYAKRLDMS